MASPEAGSSAAFKNETYDSVNDTRVKQLADYLTKYNSPLAKYAPDFIGAADKYGLDWTLVPAITGVESSFGKRIPYNSYNAYGWGNGQIYFQSWEQSIDHVSRVLKEKYLSRGLDTPVKIAPVYAPPSSTWAGKVSYFMAKIASFEPDPLNRLTL